ncbi:adenylosuccinate lyase [freshwater metagenome]|uniref:Adenylosuccinate lyase n=1 Tax=freshwater metagenome TaxID=449393 RepID=A0A094PR53_9ZZZZ
MSLSFQPLSPLDGRYASQVQELSLYLSEAALNRARIKVEIEWLILLANKEIFGKDRYITEEQVRRLRSAVDYFSDADVAKLAETEARTRHDVKAVEYFVRDKLTEIDREDLHELAHFAATSEDINNLSYALIIKDAVNSVWLPKAKQIVATLTELARSYANVPMLSRTHGQPATPTTMGKEIAVFASRLDRQVKRIEKSEFLGKFSGATGTYSAHVVAVPSANWPELAQELVESLGLKFNPLTTQIESHDWQAELYSAVAHFNRVLHNLATDIWSYISIGYFKQIPVKGATGSSTMPHKINPIRFENAEANLEISNALFDVLAQTLVTSRLQRDLTDSSSQRNIGVAFGHSLLALDNIAKGLTEIEVAESVMAADLAENWEVLTEAIQTVIRAEVVSGRSKISNPYDLLKDLSRGKRLTREDLANFILKLDIEQAAKDRLLVLSPKDYIGLAAKLAQT